MNLTLADMAREAGVLAHDRDVRTLLRERKDMAANAALRRHLELVLSRRLIGDMMDELGWSRDRYRGFSQLDESIPEGIAADDFREALAAGDRTAQEATGIVIDELLDAGCTADALAGRLQALGCPPSDLVALAMAQACLRERRTAAAVEHLNNLAHDAPTRVMGWRRVTLELLRQGDVAAAMTRAYLTVHVQRDPADACGDRAERLLRDYPQEISLADGIVRPPIDAAPAPAPKPRGLLAALRGLFQRRRVSGA